MSSVSATSVSRLAVEFGRAGYAAIGFDLDVRKVNAINEGRSYIDDVPTAHVAELKTANRLRATTNFDALTEVDTINICVPTPLRKTKDPDMSYIVTAAEEIAKRLRPGQLIILESTTYPGTTDELVLPMLEKGGLKCRQGLLSGVLSRARRPVESLVQHP